MKKLNIDDYIKRGYDKLRDLGLSEDEVQENILRLYDVMIRSTKQSLGSKYYNFMKYNVKLYDVRDEVYLSDLKGEDIYDRRYDPEQFAFRTALESAVEDMYTTLSFREADILKLIFNDEIPTYNIAESYGVTEQRINQIYHKALRKCKHPCRHRGIIEFVNYDFVFNVFKPCIEWDDNHHIFSKIISIYNKKKNKVEIIDSYKLFHMFKSTVTVYARFCEFINKHTGVIDIHIIKVNIIITAYKFTVQVLSSIKRQASVMYFIEKHDKLPSDVCKILGYMIFWGAKDEDIYDSYLMKRYIPDSIIERMCTAIWLKYHCATSGFPKISTEHQKIVESQETLRLKIQDLVDGYDNYACKNIFITYYTHNLLTYRIIIGLLHTKRYCLKNYTNIRLGIDIVWLREFCFGYKHFRDSIVAKGNHNRYHIQSTKYYNIDMDTDIAPDKIEFNSYIVPNNIDIDLITLV